MPEGISELPGFRSERPRLAADLTERRHCQHAAGTQPLRQGGMETRVAEHVTQDQVGLRRLRR